MKLCLVQQWSLQLSLNLKNLEYQFDLIFLKTYIRNQSDIPTIQINVSVSFHRTTPVTRMETHKISAEKIQPQQKMKYLKIHQKQKKLL